LHWEQATRRPVALSLAQSAAAIHPMVPHAGHFSRTRSSRATAPSAAAAIAAAIAPQLG
jgi:hypothetical protein